MRVGLHFALIFAIAAVPAQARRSANVPESEQRQVAYSYASCIVKRHPLIARNYVFGIEGKEAEKEYEKLANLDCVAGDIRPTFAMLRLDDFAAKGLFSEIFFHNQFESRSLQFESIPKLALPEPLKLEDYRKGKGKSRDEYAQSVARSQNDRAMWEIAECVARANPTGARAVLMTKIGSAEELGAVRDLTPSISNCMSSGSIRITPGQVRGAVAFSLFNLLSAGSNEGGQGA